MLGRFVNRTILPKELLGVTKIIIESDSLIICNYGALLSISDELIEVSEYLFYGNKLKLISQNPFEIEIKGKIQKVIKREK